MKLQNAIKEEAIKNPRKIKVASPESGPVEKVASVVNLAKGSLFNNISVRCSLIVWPL